MEQKIFEQEQKHLEEVKIKIEVSLEKETSALETQREELLEQRRIMWQESAHGVEDFDDIVNLASYDNRVREEFGHYVRIDKTVRQLTYLMQTPYFGRIDFGEKGEREAEPIYIGRYGFFDKKTYNCEIYDWRTPIASMFYDCSLGEAAYRCPEGEIRGELVCKRQYLIENGVLKYYYDTNMAVQDELLGRVLAENTDKVLRVIVDTITKEQNKAIRYSQLTDLLVTGPAGSGKTSVGMHRLSFLLYHNRENLTSEKIVVLSRNEIFSSYISAVLPELGEENINTVNFDSLINKGIPGKFKKAGYYEQVDYLIKNKEETGRKQAVSLKYSVGFLDYINKNIRLYKGKKRDFQAALEIYLQLLERYTRGGNRDIYEVTRADIGREILQYEDMLLASYVRILIGGIRPLDQISHVVLDEAQDYCRVQLLIIKRMYSKSKFTIMADVNQAIGYEISTVHTEDFSDIFGEKLQKTELSKSYRSTAPINRFAFGILGINNPNLYINREGKEPANIVTEEMQSTIWELLEQISPDRSVAILTCDGESARKVQQKIGKQSAGRPIQYILKPDKTLEEKIVVMPIMLAKGLEFDVVIVWDDRTEEYWEKNKNLKYLMSTRALHELYFVSLKSKETR